jgi:beta-lactamase class A
VTKDMLDSSFGELYKKGAGYTLSVREAAQIMLEQSDNTALAVIAASVKGKIPEDRTVYQYTDVDFSQNKDLTVLMNARAYSSILKCLYFSCYNNKEDSQQILQYLTKSNFNNRLAAGVADKNIKIAHKIGNYSNDVQSDCGIIYYPKRNYLLCVMLNGPDSASTDTDISMLSKITYDYVNALGK